MIEEPYRWVEAIATRRDYIEMQLATGSPVIALRYADGILLFTVGQQKLFEIYDRIALGAIGHPGDIERLRMTAIELASTEGFTRSAADVSLRRLAYYSLSPVMKNAFEQIYGAPFLARLLFVEIGANPQDDLLLKIEYDGAINLHATNDGKNPFAVLAATKKSAEQMLEFLGGRFGPGKNLRETLELAANAWVIGQIKSDDSVPAEDELRRQRSERLANGAVSAAVLERNVNAPVRYRALDATELASVISR